MLRLHRYHSLFELPVEHCGVTIGNFDGVHLGHQALIQSMAAEAKAQSSVFE